jgi:hypothetical protein
MLVLKLLGSFFLVNWIIGSWVPTYRRLQLVANGDADASELTTCVAIAIVMSLGAGWLAWLMWTD